MSDMRRVGRWGAEPGSIEDTELRIPAGIGHLDTPSDPQRKMSWKAVNHGYQQPDPHPHKL